MLPSGTRTAYRAHDDYDRREGLCIVVDTSSLVNTAGAFTVLERIQQRATQKTPITSQKVSQTAPHMLVVPTTVVNELQHLTQKETSLVADRARHLLELCVKSTSWMNRPSGTKLVGITRQKSKGESSASLDQFARVNDTKIVSCAVYFHEVTRRAAARVDNDPLDGPSVEEVMTGKRLTVLLTEDTIMRIKASAYGIPVISLSELVQCYMDL